MPREILIIRHGEAYNTVKPDGRREVPDTANPPLTPRGEQQAKRTAAVVAEFAPDVVVASPFLRVAQTATASLTGTDIPRAFDIRMSEFFIFGHMKSFKGADRARYAQVIG